LYVSLAERKVELELADRSVSATFFRNISHAVVRPNLPASDQNHALSSTVRAQFAGDWHAARSAIQGCFDDESLSDSLVALVAMLKDWSGGRFERLILLIDEAEALVAPYQLGGKKRTELEQLLQSLREVSQTSDSIAIVLSGSNHINIFAREYKNAFFGSSQSIELSGFTELSHARSLVAPMRIAPFIDFTKESIKYALDLCAGIPQFLWQLGAATSHMVGSGTVNKNDIRAAVTTLVGESRSALPFKSYDVLEPVESMLSLAASRERDLLWILLYRVAQASSLVSLDASIQYVLDSTLRGIDDNQSWTRRLTALAELNVLRMESTHSIRFMIPLFAEGFRAPRHRQEYILRLHKVTI
jgi:hypothetical protein